MVCNCVCALSRKARSDVALPDDDIYDATGGKYCGPLAVTSNSSFASYSSMLGASMPAYHDIMSVYQHPHSHVVDNNNSCSGTDRDYATTLQIRNTVPPLAAAPCGELWTCPVHGRVLSLMPRRAWRPAERLYDVAARLDAVHEDLASNPDVDIEPAPAAAATAARHCRDRDRDVVSPFYHELEPTAVDSTPCCH